MPLDFPYAEEFFQQAKALSKYDIDLSIRKYVVDILFNGCFEIVSPTSGKTVSSGTSIVLRDKSVFFGFPAEPGLLVAVGNLGQGFPITAFAVGDTLRSIDDPLWGINARSLAVAQHMIRSVGWSATVTTEPLLVSGDGNFAHFAWNQLPALSAAVSCGRNFKVASTHEPLGPLSGLIPEIAENRISRVPASWLDRANAQGRTFVPLGSSRVSLAVRNRVIAYARRSLSVPAQACLARLAAFPMVLWVSVRTRNRTASNQVALLATVCRRFLDAFPAAGVLIDGHSLPADLASNSGSYDGRAVMAVVEADRKIADEVVSAVGDEGRFVQAVGLPISDTLVLAQHATVYFCHHGTVQHKVGWFTSTPGVVHCNPETLALHPAVWVQSQSEVAALPTYLPESIVAAAGSAESKSDIEASLHLDNYTVLDLERCADMVIAACPA